MNGLGKGVVHFHLVGYGWIKVVTTQLNSQIFSKFPGDIQNTGKPTDIAHSLCLQSDTEGRHKPQEEAVEMIGAKGDYQLRIKFIDGFHLFFESRLQFPPLGRFFLVAIHQRAV